MKRLWSAFFLFLLLAAATLLNAYHTRSLTEHLTGRLEQAQVLARQDLWSRAGDLTRLAYDEWQSEHFYLHCTMRHDDTDEILRAFRAVLQYLELQEMDQYAAANTDLIILLQLLSEMEQPSLVNIL